MCDFNFNNFNDIVDDVLVRHKSILDIITKLQETNSKINRAIIKSVTACGCIEINGKLQQVPEHIT